MLAATESEQLWRHWEWPLLPLITTLATGVIYLRGWASARRTRAQELAPWRALCFVGGLLVVWLAIASPLAALDDFLLTAHMFQHILLMSVAPPLIVLGSPVVPLLRGLPHVFVRTIVRPLIIRPWIQTIWHAAAHPASVWLMMNVTFLAWHTPRAFVSTFTSETLHDLEHAMFFFTSCAFWWIVLAPWPATRTWPRWAMVPYLLSSDLLNTILCALLAFSGKLFYQPYALAPRITRLSPAQDQVAAGGEMWLLNSAVFLCFATYLTFTSLSFQPLLSFAAPRSRS